MADRITVSGTPVVTEDDSTGAVTARVDALTDLADAGDWETLKLLGFSEGDFVPLNTFSTRSSLENTTTSSAYVAGLDVNDFLIVPDSYPGDLAYRLMYKLNPNGDQIDIRMWNAEDDEAWSGTQSSYTGGEQTVVIGPETYSPPTTSSAIQTHPQYRNSDGTTTVTLEMAQMEIGAIL